MIDAIETQLAEIEARAKEYEQALLELEFWCSSVEQDIPALVKAVRFCVTEFNYAGGYDHITRLNAIAAILAQK